MVWLPRIILYNTDWTFIRGVLAFSNPRFGFRRTCVFCILLSVDDFRDVPIRDRVGCTGVKHFLSWYSMYVLGICISATFVL